MASSENLMTMEPWAFRSAFSDSWFSDLFTKETETLSKALQKSLSSTQQPQLMPEADMISPCHKPELTQALTPTVSGGSEKETSGSTRRSNVRVSGKVTKRKSRASRRNTTTYITADVDNFREMVQQVTGVRFGVNGQLPVAHVLKPAPQRPVNRLLQSCCLPTLDTSAFLLDHVAQKQQLVDHTSTTLHAQPASSTAVSAPPSAVFVDGGSSGFDFDSFSSFPTL